MAGPLRWARMVDAARQPSASSREQAARLPPGPGVYRFRGAAGHVLYLGRAVSLRRPPAPDRDAARLGRFRPP